MEELLSFRAHPYLKVPKMGTFVFRIILMYKAL